MAAAIRDRLGVEAELIKGDQGVFDVAVDGEVVFSKHDEGDFISTPEMVGLVKARFGKRLV